MVVMERSIEIEGPHESRKTINYREMHGLDRLSARHLPISHHATFLLFKWRATSYAGNRTDVTTVEEIVGTMEARSHQVGWRPAGPLQPLVR
jgi:hypothetical protein